MDLGAENIDAVGGHDSGYLGKEARNVVRYRW